MGDKKKDDEDHKDGWKHFTEEIETTGQKLIGEVTRLISEGNVRKLRVRTENNDVALEIPLTAGAVVGGVVVLAAPLLVVLGTLAGLVAKIKIEVVREGDPKQIEGKRKPTTRK